MEKSVGATVTVHSPQVWGSRSILRFSLWPQTLHFRVFSPCSVQVASLMVFQLPYMWDFFLSASVFVWPQAQA